MSAKRASRTDQDFYPWSPIVARPPLRWPEGVRVARAESQFSMTANTLQQGELHKAVQNLAGRVICKGSPSALRGLTQSSALPRALGTAAANNRVSATR
jgi:hypothetical protein